MPFSLRRLMTVVICAGLLLAGWMIAGENASAPARAVRVGGRCNDRDSRECRALQRMVPVSRAVRRSWWATPDYPSVLNYMNALEAAHWKALEEIVAYAATVPAPRPEYGGMENSRVVPVGGGIDFVALARCESGLNPYTDPSPWRTGYFGLEFGYPIGQNSLEWQMNEVRRIYAAHGESAWGVLCRSAFG